MMLLKIAIGKNQYCATHLKEQNVKTLVIFDEKVVLLAKKWYTFFMVFRSVGVILNNEKII